jgi:hypothetical protein
MRQTQVSGCLGCNINLILPAGRYESMRCGRASLSLSPGDRLGSRRPKVFWHLEKDKGFFCLSVYFETGYVAWAGFELVILLLPPLECWYYRCAPPHPVPNLEGLVVMFSKPTGERPGRGGQWACGSLNRQSGA